MVGGKMSGGKLEKVLNDQARDGWQLKAVTAVEVKGRIGPGGVEGVLVTGTAVAQLEGECVRCLTGIFDEVEVDVQELFTYPGSEATDEEASHLDGELIDLEPVLRDAIVLELPFQPMCQPDCPGLCPECGARLAEDPDHSHEAPVDPRWAGLADLTQDLQQDLDEKQS